MGPKLTKDAVLLVESTLPKDPITLFSSWLEHANQKLPKYQMASAMCLSTSDKENVSGRMVMVRKFDQTGFLFFTNGNSKKSGDLEKLPNAALTSYWSTEGSTRSVRIEGTVRKIPEEGLLKAWSMVPRANKIQITLSEFSSSVASGGREELEKKQRELEEKYPESSAETATTIPKPDYWVGYKLIPRRIEFWHERQASFPDRFEYKLSDEKSTDDTVNWVINRLNP